MAAKKDQKAQSKRFVEKAKELGADESGEAFEHAFKRIVPPNREKSTDHIEKGHLKHD